jgi:hypothetical protein
MEDDLDLQVPAEKDMSGTVFSDPAFFRSHARLTDANVLTYFSASPFWESNNLNARTLDIIFLHLFLQTMCIETHHEDHLNPKL